MNQTEIISTENAKRYTWAELCESFILLGSPGLSVKQERMPAGTREKLHYHKAAQQFFYVLKGKARFHLDDNLLNIKPMQGICVPAGKNHFIENTSPELLEFLVISQPATDADRVNC